jgi:galactose mutarotase-like enzyme
MIYISNEQLTVTINEKGAELQSVQLNGLEYLWQADGKYWGKHSPVLFPVVGELRDGKYFFEGREYRLSRHGFARDKIFKAEQTSETSVTLTLQDDAETLSLYPFQFVFRIEYKVQGPELFCTYIVENSDTKTIYFSAGGQPAFKVPLTENLSYTDYKLEFNNDEVLNRHLLVKGLTGNNTE